MSQSLFEFEAEARRYPQGKPYTTAMNMRDSFERGTRWWHYDHGHPWHYVLGGVPLDPGAMKPRKAYTQKVLRLDRKLVPLEERVKSKRAELAAAVARYRELIRTGPAGHKPEPWHTSAAERRLSWAGSMSASYAHITWIKGELRELAGLSGRKVPAWPKNDHEAE